tara:strand:+ start:200 stop:679 length:480 start_codon:yes stop_codon:yes gene_type:complete
MANNTVVVQEVVDNTVTAQDIINSVTVSESDSNSVTVVAATFVSDSGSSSSLFYSTGAPSNSVGVDGDFYIDVSSGELYGPKASAAWPADALALIPKRNVHTQSVASASWAITHTLSGYPSVTIVDSAGTVVEGDVKYNSTSSLTLTFASAFTGKAYLT